jgi:hypothetical protein
MISIEFIQSIDWLKPGLPRRMHAIQPACLPGQSFNKEQKC